MLRRHELLRRIRRKPSFSVRPFDGRRIVVKELMRRIAQSAGVTPANRLLRPTLTRRLMTSCLAAAGSM
jgi:hypothetical protein